MHYRETNPAFRGCVGGHQFLEQGQKCQPSSRKENTLGDSPASFCMGSFSLTNDMLIYTSPKGHAVQLPCIQHLC